MDDGLSPAGSEDRQISGLQAPGVRFDGDSLTGDERGAHTGVRDRGKNHGQTAQSGTSEPGPGPSMARGLAGSPNRMYSRSVFSKNGKSVA